MSPEFCLRWNNHRPNLVSVFKELLQHEVLVDVTLAAGGQFIHAHRLVLSACSMYFKELFAVNPCQHPIVILKDFHIEDLKTVVDFIYQGEVNVAQERLPHVLRTAESLRIKGLAENPHSFEEYQSNNAGPGTQHNTTPTPRLGTQSREHSMSVDGGEDSIGGGVGEDTGPSSHGSPPHKRRRVGGRFDDQHHVDPGAADGGGSGVRVKEEPNNNSNTSGDRHRHPSDGGDSGGGSATGPLPTGCLIRDNPMLVLHGNMSPGLASSGVGGAVGSSTPTGGDAPCGSPIPPDVGVCTGENNNDTTVGPTTTPTPPPSLPPTPLLASLTTNILNSNNSSSSSSVDGGGGGGATTIAPLPALTPPDSGALLQHPGQGRSRRVLKRQPGIIRDAGSSLPGVAFVSSASSEARILKEARRGVRTLVSGDDVMPGGHDQDSCPDYVLPHSVSMVSVPCSNTTAYAASLTAGTEITSNSSTGAPGSSLEVTSGIVFTGAGVDSVVLSGGQGYSSDSGSQQQDIPTYGSGMNVSGSATSLLQIPAVVVAAPPHRDSGSTGPGPLPKQVSQPELGDARSVVHHQYGQHHPMISRSLGSIGSSGSLGSSSSTSSLLQESTGTSGGQHLQVMQVFLKQEQQQKQPQIARSSSGSIITAGGQVAITSISSSLPSALLRPIQPKPAHEDTTTFATIPVHRASVKEEAIGLQPLYQRKDALYLPQHQQPPLIRLTPSEDVTPAGPPPARLPRAISEEPFTSRHTSDLLGPSPVPLTSSVSEDTGLDVGLTSSRMLPHASHSIGSQSSSSSISSSCHYSTLGTVPPTSGHRLALRDGPALGCNFCWNSTDDHGRIQRRKTKYHCPECRTNLCIVPCYQKYHKQMEKADDTDKQITKILTKTSSI